MATNNGDKGLGSCRDVRGYQEPTGPKHRHGGVGLQGGENFGNAGSQGKSRLTCGESGSETDLNTSATLLGGSQRG